MKSLANFKLADAQILSAEQQKKLKGGDWYTDCAEASIRLDKLSAAKAWDEWGRAWVEYKDSGCPMY